MAAAGSPEENKRKSIIPLEKKKKARKNLTLDLSPGKLDGWLKKHVHFDDIVLVKVGEKQRMVLLKGH